jgi:hypothetical protein
MFVHVFTGYFVLMMASMKPDGGGIQNLNDKHEFTTYLANIFSACLTNSVECAFCRFSKNQISRQQWIVAVRKKNFVPSDTAVLC